MRRRDFLCVLGGAATWPVAARAQQSSMRRRPLIGYLGGASFEGARPTIEPWLEGMRALGHVPEQTVDITYLFADGDYRRLPQLAKDLAFLQPNVILAATALTAIAAAEASPNIPIVCPLFDDIISSSNDARPERNITGVRQSVRGLGGKLVDLAREIVPGAKRIGILANATISGPNSRLDDILTAAKFSKLEIVRAAVLGPSDMDGAFRQFADEHVNVSIVHADSLFFAERARLARIAAEQRIPTVYGIREHVAAGGLASYGVDLRANFRRAATFVDHLLKGARPADLPIELPTNFVLAINLKTAKALGLEVPLFLQQRADEVIE